MKILFAVSTLLATAAAAVVFPEMKKLLILIPFALLALCFSGCASLADIKKHLRDLPDGHYDSAVIAQTNLGVGVTVTAENLTLSGNDISFTTLALDGRTPWTGTTTVTLKGGSMDVSPASRAKKVLPSTPQKSAPADPAPVAATVPAATGAAK